MLCGIAFSEPHHSSVGLICIHVDVQSHAIIFYILRNGYLFSFGKANKH